MGDYSATAGSGESGNIPTTPHSRTQLLLQPFNLALIQPPKVRMIVQTMPRLHWGNFAVQVDARGQFQEFLDDGSTSGPLLIDFGGPWCTSDEWS